MPPQEVDIEQVYRCIGRFVYEFSQFEHELRVAVWDEFVRYGEFFNEVMCALDVSPLCYMALSIFKQKWAAEQFAAGESIIKKFMSINDLRNRVVHGQWLYTIHGGTVIHTSRYGKSGIFENQVKEVDEKTEELTVLYAAFCNLVQQRTKVLYADDPNMQPDGLDNILENIRKIIAKDEDGKRSPG